MTNTELLFALTLQPILKLGDNTAKKLIRHLASAEAVIKEKFRNGLKLMELGYIK